ncbi:MAG: hypothetical protein WBM13_13040, partial [Bacteroidia bacterium]
MNTGDTFTEFLPLFSEAFERVSGKKFIAVPEKMKTYELLYYYFKRDIRFEEAGYSLDKGLYVLGPVGVGKTMMMKVFQYLRYTGCPDTGVSCFHDGPQIAVVPGLDITTNYNCRGAEYLNTQCYR